MLAGKEEKQQSSVEHIYLACCGFRYARAGSSWPGPASIPLGPTADDVATLLPAGALLLRRFCGFIRLAEGAAGAAAEAVVGGGSRG